MRGLAIGLLLLATSQAQPPAVGTGAISGRVLDGSTGQPIDSAVVVLSTSNRSLPTAVVLRLSTDSAGRFVFTRLPADRPYFIHVVQFGYFDGGHGLDVPGSSEGRPIVFANGEWVDDIKVLLWRPASIAGRVIDEGGEPVVGAFVRVLPQILVAGLPRVAAGAIVKTDDRGMYRIGGLAPGKYIISFPSVQTAVPTDTPPAMLLGMSADNYRMAAERIGQGQATPEAMSVDATTSVIVGSYIAPPLPRDGRARLYPPLFYPAARALGEATPVDVQFGEERGGVDLQLRPEPAVRVSGRVNGPPEAVAGLTLRLLPRGSEGLGIGSEVATALVGASGTFTMPFVPVGEYTLLSGRTTMQYNYVPNGSNLQSDLPNPPAFGGGSGGAGTVNGATPGVGYSVRSASGDLTYFGRMPLAVTAPEVKDVVLDLKPSVTIRGRLIVESGTLQPPGGGVGSASGGGPPPPPTRSPMYAEPADGNSELGMPGGWWAMASRQFEVTGLQPGQYRLRFWGVPFVKSIVWEGRDLTYDAFDAAEGHDFNGVEVTLTDQAATIEGYVRDESGNKAGDAVVLAFPTDRRRWTRYGFAPAHLRSASVTNSGTYTLKLPGGDYYVVAVDPAKAGGLYDPAFLAAAVRVAETVRVGWGETKTQAVTQRVIR
jgi:5-hydroxyisourate hydrolase-like protein (transthyretin family)